MITRLSVEFISYRIWQS